MLDEPPNGFDKGKWLTVDPGSGLFIMEWTDGVMTNKFYYRNALAEYPFVLDTAARNVIIEDVELWSGSAVSYASATQGDTFRLAMQIGALINDYRNARCNIYLVSPRRWKGQLNYEQLRFILSHKFKIITKNDHEASAYGIGLWAKGLL